MIRNNMKNIQPIKESNASIIYITNTKHSIPCFKHFFKNLEHSLQFHLSKTNTNRILFYELKIICFLKICIHMYLITLFFL